MGGEGGPLAKPHLLLIANVWIKFIHITAVINLCLPFFLLAYSISFPHTRVIKGYVPTNVNYVRLYTNNIFTVYGKIKTFIPETNITSLLCRFGIALLLINPQNESYVC